MQKSIFLFTSFLLLMVYCSGQKPSIGITAGPVFSYYKDKVGGDPEFTSTTKTGFTVGIQSSIPIWKYCSLMPALNFIQKGGKRNDQGYTTKTVLNYMELPLNLVFHANSAGGKFFAGAGPSLSLGLSGKIKWKDSGGSGSDDIHFGSGRGANLKAFEAGINFLAGYEFKGGFQVSANYNAGLSNLGITSYPDDTPPIEREYHNRYFGIRLGYMLPCKKK